LSAASKSIPHQDASASWRSGLIVAAGPDRSAGRLLHFAARSDIAWLPFGAARLAPGDTRMWSMMRVRVMSATPI